MIRYHDHIEAMNTVGWFLGDHGITTNLVIKSAEENGLSGLGYFLPDGSYFQWRKSGDYILSDHWSSAACDAIRQGGWQ